MANKKCRYCGYKWESIKENPVSCPRCKRRIDVTPKRQNLFHKIGDLMEEEINIIDE